MKLQLHSETILSFSQTRNEFSFHQHSSSLYIIYYIDKINNKGFIQKITQHYFVFLI